MSCNIGLTATPAPQPCGVVTSNVTSATAVRAAITLNAAKIPGDSTKKVPLINHTNRPAISPMDSPQTAEIKGVGALSSHWRRLAAGSGGTAHASGDRRYAFSGFLMAVTASMMAVQTERSDEMFLTMARRHGAQIVDLDAEVLEDPAGASARYRRSCDP